MKSPEFGMPESTIVFSVSSDFKEIHLPSTWIVLVASSKSNSGDFESDSLTTSLPASATNIFIKKSYVAACTIDDRFWSVYNMIGSTKTGFVSEN